MKKAITMAAIAAMCVMLFSCSKEEEHPEDDGKTEVIIHFYEVEPMTRAAVADFATRLDVWIYESGAEVQAVHQQSTDTDFATLAVTLDRRKTYTLYAVAHKGTATATLADGVVAFPDDKVTHSFYYTTIFTPSETTSLSCVMDRIVGNFRMEMTDAVPDGVARMVIDMGQSPTRWNVAGYGVNVAERTASFTPAEGSTPTLSVFLIAGSDEPTDYDITVTAYDSENEVMQQRVFEGVPIRNGYRTTYRGMFFSDQAMTATFTVTDWNDYDVVEF